MFWQSAFRVTGQALQYLFRFLKYFLMLLSVAVNAPLVQKVSEKIPLTIKTAEKMIGLVELGIVEFVVCPKCHSVYEYENCLNNGRPKTCFHKKYPNHPHPSRRKSCNSPLLKIVNKRHIPIMTYPYFPIHKSIQRMALKPNFLSSCEQWRQREPTIPSVLLGDIYDGIVWKSFNTNFLTSPYSLLLSLNVDWFQPYKHIQYSVGCIYLIIQNLPREKRYLEENVILVGIMPGPKESHLSIDSYLQPMVNELNSYYYNGLSVVSNFGHQITIRVALSCFSCDIPATGQVCGFLGHNAKLGCNKCYKRFDVGATGGDYSGFNRETWEERKAQKHREDCKKIKSCTTKRSTQQMESTLGVRPSALLELEYFDPIKHVAVDAMHNLFLGTAKHMFKVWLELELISKQGLDQIDQFISTYTVPNNVGRLPLHMSSNYSCFKAAQWSTWTTIYSPVVLQNVLPSEHYKSWLLFVRACTLLTQRIIRISDVHTADQLLVNFCKSVERLYGKNFCTPNMHLHLHLKETLLYYGPLHATWCFSFERYNGLFGTLPTNKKCIELQFMKKFIKSQYIDSLSHKITDTELIQLIRTKESDEVALSIFQDNDVLNLLQLSHGPFQPVMLSYCDNVHIKRLGVGKECLFSSLEIKHLHGVYSQLNPGKTIEYVSPFYHRYGKVSIGGDILGSVLNSHSAQSSSVIAAFWGTFGHDINRFTQSERSIGKVQYYIHNAVTIKDEISGKSTVVNFTLAYVLWKEYHHQNSLYGISATVCANSVKE